MATPSRISTAVATIPMKTGSGCEKPCTARVNSVASHALATKTPKAAKPSRKGSSIETRTVATDSPK